MSRCLVVLDYDDTAGRLVGALKYRGSRSGLGWLTDAMVSRVAHADLHPEIVTWAPASPRHRRRRGFDQAGLLARGLADALGVAALDLLGRSGEGSQTGRSRPERLRGPDLWLRGNQHEAAGRAVLVVDDVVTTGATLRTAGAVLVAAGAREVNAIAVAHRR